MNKKIFFLFFIFFFINPNLQSAQLTEESSLFLNSLKGDVKEAYDYAVKNPEILSNFSCYCGCEKIKHTSNKSCFIKKIDQDIISLTNHSVSCPICIDVALTVKYLTQDGFSLKEIRSILDDAYDGYPSTQTKLELNGGSKKAVVMNKILFLALIIISITSCNGNKKMDSQFILIDKVISKEYELKKFEYKGLINYRAANEAYMEELKFKELKGYNIINFWASWCYPCIEEVDDFNEYMTLEASDMEIIGINIFDEYEEAKQFILLNEPNYPNFFDETKTIPVEFGVSGVPETFFLYDNKIIYKYVGKLKVSSISEGLEKTQTYVENNN